MNEKICEICFDPLEDATPSYWTLVRLRNPYILEYYCCANCIPEIPYTSLAEQYPSREEADLALITYKLTR